MMMHAECIEFKEKEVNDQVFELEEDLEQIDFKSCEPEVQELFDILLH